MTGRAFHDCMARRRFGFMIGCALSCFVLSLLLQARMSADYSGGAFLASLGVCVIVMGLAMLAVERMHVNCPWCDADWSAITWPRARIGPTRCPECGISLDEPIPIRPAKSKGCPPTSWDDELG